MNTKTLSELEDKYVGKQGTPERGSNLTIKTLRDIVERGLGGKLNIEVQF